MELTADVAMNLPREDVRSLAWSEPNSRTRAVAFMHALYDASVGDVEESKSADWDSFVGSKYILLSPETLDVREKFGKVKVDMSSSMWNAQPCVF